MIPMRSLAETRIVVGPPAIIRYNNLRAVTVQGGPAPGVSSGQALKAFEEVAAKTLPPGYAGEWTDTAFQEKRAEGKTAIILGFAVLFAYLFLVALYESWTIPVPGVAVGLDRHPRIVCRHRAERPDARSLRPDRHGRADRSCRQERHSDRRVCQGAARAAASRCCEAATEGARLRFRPVMMTSFAFILGLYPLVVASGASELARRDVGTPVFGGMILASFIGIFAIPPLYVMFQAIREKLRPGARPDKKLDEKPKPAAGSALP